MPSLATLTASQIVQLFAAAAQAVAQTLLDFSVGSIDLAYAEGVTLVGLWLQALIIRVAGLTRFATSYGSDADSWGAQFDYDRLAGSEATGSVTFARASAANATAVPVGFQITANGQTYTVGTDTTNPAYSPTAAPNGQPGYAVAVNVTSMTVPVECDAVGTIGNALANTITGFVGSIPFIDSVTNATPLTNGVNAEVDPAYKNRFPYFVAGWRRGTWAAIEGAIEGLAPNVTCQVIQGQTYSGSSMPGYIYALVDDGSGNPPQSLLDAAAALMDQYVAAGIVWGVYGPTIVTSNVAMALTSADSSQHAADIAAAQAALQQYLATLPVGTSLSYTRLAAIAYGASSNITDVTSVTLNGGTADLLVSVNQVIKPGTVVPT